MTDLEFVADKLAVESIMECRRAGAEQAHELMAAGWSFELPEIINRKSVRHKLNPTEPWQWYWRAPPKRIGKKGRRYFSTNQAFNVMKREYERTKTKSSMG